VADKLKTLEPGALEALKSPATEIVRLFYGLVDGTPWTQLAIVEHLGLSKTRVARILASAPVTRLLGEPPHGKVLVVQCAICGSTVERTPQQLRDRVQTTCSAACRREFQRRQAALRSTSKGLHGESKVAVLTVS
jgi:hypothetical protein